MTTQIYTRLLAIMLSIGLATSARADVPEPPEPSEQHLQHVEMQAAWAARLQDALILLANNKPDQALEALESIQNNFPDLDTNGMVALAIGDCLFRLKQYEQARKAYQAAAEQHPDLADSLWMRLVEADLALDRFTSAADSLTRVLAGHADAEDKSYAALRLAMVLEHQAIRSLQQAENAYRKAAEAYPGRNPGAKRWRQTHADDLRDTVAQLQAALAQMDNWIRHMPVIWTDGLTPRPALSVQIDKANLAGQLSEPEETRLARPTEKTAVELTVDKDQKLEITVAGKKVPVDEAAQRQILKHLQQALRAANQAKEPNGN